MLRTDQELVPDFFGGRLWDLAAVAALLVLATLALVTFVDYGVTWDEVIQWEYGRRVLGYYATAGQDRSAFGYLDTRYYGPLFELLAAGAQAISPFGLYETRHLVNAGVGLVALAGAFRLARHLGGPRAGFVALLLLALTPRFYGHAFANPKDIPFAAGYIWSVYLLVRALPALPRIPWRLVLGLGVAIGLTLAVRIGALMLLVYLGGLLALSVIGLGVRARSLGAAHGAARTALGRLGAVIALAWILMVLPWPWALESPLVRPLQAFVEMGRFTWHHTVLFQGREIPATAVPATYVPVWLGITLPAGMLLLLAVGAVLALHSFWRAPRRLDASRLQRAFLVAAVVLPPAWVVLSRAVIYDGMRHLLFIVPPAMVLGALSLEAVLRRLPQRAPRWGLGAALALYLGFLAVTMAGYHPYQASYFNELVGGLPGAAGRYETDYWGSSYKEAVALLVERVHARYGEDPPVFRVKAESGHMSTEYYLPPWLQPTPKARDADFFIATTRWRKHESVRGEVVGVVERFGVPLNYVIDLRGRLR